VASFCQGKIGGDKMQVGDLVKHTPTGDFVVVLELGGCCARICFVTGRIMGFKAWYGTRFLEVI